jgi:hypothetical protein
MLSLAGLFVEELAKARKKAILLIQLRVSLMRRRVFSVSFRPVLIRAKADFSF